MKIKITQKGNETYTGNLGGVEFVDGESVDVVSRFIALRLGSIMSIEEVGTGKNPGAAQQILDAGSIPMDAGMAPAIMVPQDTTRGIHQKSEKFERFTREQLDEIASVSGLPGLREIAAPAGISAKNINALIQAILDKGITNPARPVRVAGDDTTRERVTNEADGKATLAASSNDPALSVSVTITAPGAPATITTVPTTPAPVASAANVTAKVSDNKPEDGVTMGEDE